MSVDAIVVISIGAAFGGLVNGLAGFGTGLFALGWWLVVLPPKSAVALVVVLSLVSGVQGVFAVSMHLIGHGGTLCDPGFGGSAVWLCHAGAS